MGVGGRSANEIRRCLWQIVQDRPTGLYLTWQRLCQYLRLTYTAGTLRQFAAGGDRDAYRTSDEFLQALNEALNEIGI